MARPGIGVVAHGLDEIIGAGTGFQPSKVPGTALHNAERLIPGTETWRNAHRRLKPGTRLEDVQPDIGIVPGFFGKGVGREIGALKASRKTRTFTHGDLKVQVPAASSRTGRVVEHVLDNNRERLSKVGLMKTGAEKVGEVIGRRVEHRAKVLTTPGDALKKVSRRLTGGQEYALRIMSEHSLPGNPITIEDRFRFHTGRIATADKQSATYHAIHADLINKAKKYLVEHADGSITLTPNAPRRLQESWRLLQEVAQGREDLYRQIQYLSDESIRNRIQAPGRVLLGAQYTGDEKLMAALLDSSPQRQKVFDVIDQTIEDATQNAAAKSAIDQAARRYAEVATHDPVQSVADFYGKLDAELGHVPENANTLEQASLHPNESGDLLPPPKLEKGGPRTNEDLIRIAEENAAKGEPKTLNQETLQGYHGGPIRGTEVYMTPNRDYASAFAHGDEAVHLLEINAQKVLRHRTLTEWFATGEKARDWAGGHEIAAERFNGDAQKMIAAYARAHGYDAIVNDAAVNINFNHVPGQGTVPVAEAVALDPSAVKVLEQRAHSSFEGTLQHGVLKGSVTFEDGKALIHAVEGHADVSTWIHELGHIVRRTMMSPTEEDRAAKWAGAQLVDGQWRWTRDAEEKYARGLEQWFRDGHGPAGLKDVFKTASAHLRELYSHADLPDVSPEMRDIFERIFTPTKQKGSRLVGAEDFNFGVNYAAYMRGVPVSMSRPGKMLGAYVRKMTQLFNPSTRSAVGAGPDDALLHKTFTGALLDSGFFKADVTDAAVENLMVATRLTMAKLVRDALIPAGSKVPQAITDIAVKIDATKNVTPEMKALMDRLESVHQGGEKLGAKDLEGIDFRLVEKMREDLFPGQIEGKDVREHAAQIMSEVSEPLDNYVWVPREMLDASGVLYTPRAAKVHLKGLSKSQRFWIKGGGMTLDALNDVQKGLILYLNPAYVPVNLAGNLTMNALHQGVFMPINLWRASMLHRELAVEERLLVDKLMGHGLTGSLSLKTSPGQVLNHTLGHWMGLATDLIPRRSAFLHEARKLGYVKLDEVQGLLQRGLKGDETALNELQHIRDKAADAIVDYERMTPFEREVIARWIFVYPWLRGASRYAVRFTADHPIQTVALALMAEHAHENADKILRPRPYYAALDTPISTDSLGVGPWSLSDLVGKHQMVRPDGKPYVFNYRQLLTQTTPFELVEAGVGGVGAPIARALGAKDAADFLNNMPSVADNLAPLPSAVATMVTGYDPNTHKEVPRDFGTLFGAMRENVTALNKIDQYNSANPESEKTLYPRSKTEVLEAMFGGRLAPTPYNPKVGRERAQAPQKQSRDAKSQEWQKRATKTLGSLPQEVVDAERSKTLYHDAQEHRKKELGVDTLTDKQRTRLKLTILASVHPEYAEVAHRFGSELPDAETPVAAAIDRWAERTLGWALDAKYHSYVNRVEAARG